jgi:formate dehydrogenase iron-sulfur subunit
MDTTVKKTGRRQFIKMLAGTSAYAALGTAGFAGAQPLRYGKLVDTTKCIGCKRCMSACKRWNQLKVERDELVTDRETHLSAQNWVVVNLRADTMNRTRRTYQHWACQHCIQPACAGACPVRAITKLPHGNVVVNEKKCIGCRYCYQSCPFKVPQFDFEKRVTRKCHLCYDRILINYSKPACVAACPVGALSFGYKHEMILEAKRRVSKEKTARYILGLKEAGGTDMLTILTAKPEDLGLVVAPQKVVNRNLDKLRITAAGFMSASALAGMMYMYRALTGNNSQ